MELIYLTLGLQLLIGVHCVVVDSRTEIATSRSNTDFNEEHDFIVIGNGVSGSIVAKRLSENFNWSILVLEAGDDPSLQSDDARKGSVGFDWNYPKEDPLYFLNGHTNKVAYLPSKLMGQAKATWNWDDLTKYFQGNDHTQEEDLPNPYGYRTRSALTESKYKPFIQDAYKQRGIKYVTDKNAAEFIGLSSTVRYTLRDETSGIKSKKPKSNLRIIYNAFATSVDLNSKGYVEAVNYIRNNHRSTFLKAKARKEYIISAGAYLTPKILMLSGLGPVDHLKEVGIKPNCNLKVGQNLQDHAVIPYFMKVACTDLEPDRLSSQSRRTHYLDFVALTNSRPRAKTYPNIMNTCRIVDCKDFNTMNLLLEDLPDEIKKNVLRETKNHHIMVVGIHNIRPKSKGEIKLHSKDPFDAPVVENNLFNSSSDIEAMIAGIRQQQNLLKSEAFEGYSEVTPYLEKCAKMKKDSDAFWECYIRTVGLPFEDAIGTVKMGTEFDPNAVVDACFQVFTTYNLRVIDASVVPSISSGPTYLQAVKVGEKGAELIIKDHS